MNKSGHIIIELLLSSVIFTIIMMMVLQIIIMLKTEIDINKSNMDNLLLVNRIQDDIYMCKTIVSIDPFGCVLYNNEKLMYKVNNGDIVRTINKKGYEVIANEVDEFKVVNKTPLEFQIINFGEKSRIIGGITNE